MRFNWAIDAILKVGTSPEIAHFISPVDRSETIAKIEGLLHNHSSCDGLFGVILGPSGTGKTYATRVACNRDPSFILYYEIYKPRMTAQELSRAAGFVEEGFFDGHLAENQVVALSQVLDIIGKRAERMKKTKNLKSPPCFVIDGVELVAKYDAKLFETIVDRAKFWANKNGLRIVLVSSEGHVMPLIENTSSSSRAAEVIEVLDLEEAEAVQYLYKNGIPMSLAKRFPSITGNRMVHLSAAIFMYNQRLQTRIILNEDEFFVSMTQYYAKYVELALSKAEANSPTSFFIMKEILKHGPMTDRQLIQAARNYNKESIEEIFLEKQIPEVIGILVTANLLRYQANKTLTWHSQIIYDSVRKDY